MSKFFFIAAYLAFAILLSFFIIYLAGALFLTPIIISAALFAGMTSLGFISSFANFIKRENGEKEKKLLKNFLKEFETAYEKEDADSLIEELFENKITALGSSKKEIRNFLEEQSKDELGNTFLHKIVSLEDTNKAISILSSIYKNVPDVNWNVKNNNDQTLLHIVAERNSKELAEFFSNGKVEKFKFNLSIKDKKNKTAMMITEEKEEVLGISSKSFERLYEQYRDLCSEVLLNSRHRDKERIINKTNMEYREQYGWFPIDEKSEHRSL